MAITLAPGGPGVDTAYTFHGAVGLALSGVIHCTTPPPEKIGSGLPSPSMSLNAMFSEITAGEISYRAQRRLSPRGLTYNTGGR